MQINSQDLSPEIRKLIQKHAGDGVIDAQELAEIRAKAGQSKDHDDQVLVSALDANAALEVVHVDQSSVQKTFDFVDGNLKLNRQEGLAQLKKLGAATDGASLDRLIGTLLDPVLGQDALEILQARVTKSPDKHALEKLSAFVLHKPAASTHQQREALRLVLDSGKGQVAKDLAQAVFKLDEKDPKLLRFQQMDVAACRMMAADYLAEQGYVSISTMEKWLDSGNFGLQEAARKGLAKVDDPKTVEGRTAWELKRINNQSGWYDKQHAFRDLLDTLQGDEPAKRQARQDVDKAMSEYLKNTPDMPKELRFEFLKLRLRIHPSQARDEIRSGIYDLPPKRQKEALEILAKPGDQAAKEAIRLIYVSVSAPPALKTEAAKLLLDKQWSSLDTLQRMLQDSDPTIRERAMDGLIKHPNPKAIDILTKAAREPDTKIDPTDAEKKLNQEMDKRKITVISKDYHTDLSPEAELARDLEEGLRQYEAYLGYAVKFAKATGKLPDLGAITKKISAISDKLKLAAEKLEKVKSAVGKVADYVEMARKVIEFADNVQEFSKSFDALVADPTDPEAIARFKKSSTEATNSMTGPLKSLSTSLLQKGLQGTHLAANAGLVFGYVAIMVEGGTKLMNQGIENMGQYFRKIDKVVTDIEKDVYVDVRGWPPEPPEMPQLYFYTTGEMRDSYRSQELEQLRSQKAKDLELHRSYAASNFEAKELPSLYREKRTALKDELMRSLAYTKPDNYSPQQQMMAAWLKRMQANEQAQPLSDAVVAFEIQMFKKGTDWMLGNFHPGDEFALKSWLESNLNPWDLDKSKRTYRFKPFLDFYHPALDRHLKEADLD